MPPIEIPVHATVDILVIGGSTAAVSCAVAATRGGATVFLAAPRPYLGEDLCAGWRYWEEDDDPGTDLAHLVLDRDPPSPLHVKRTLEQALVGRSIPFALGLHPAGILRDDAGRIAGVVIADRAGLQIIRAREVVDATWHGVVARQAGAAFVPFPAGKHAVERVLVGPDLVVEGSAGELLGPLHEAVVHGHHASCEARRFRIQVTFPVGGPVGYAAAETAARRRIFHPDQSTASERIHLLPPDGVVPGIAHVKTWPGAAALPLVSLRVEDGLHLLSPSADLTRQAATKLIRPRSFMTVGERLGASLATTGGAIPQGDRYAIADAAPVDAEVRVLIAGLRNLGHQGQTVAVNLSALPILGEYDVVVTGGGTAGAPAGIAAARVGARTLVLEYQSDLGGVSTVGLIGRYYHGNRVGFTAEIDAGVACEEPSDSPRRNNPTWKLECKQQWYLEQLADAGAEVWLWTAAVGAVMAGDQVVGVLVAGPHGFGVVRAKAVVDASGNADLAAASGATCIRAGDVEPAVQGTGMSPKHLGSNYVNSDHTFSDDCDVVDATNLLVSSKVKFVQAFDLAQLVDSRERRQVVGDLVLDPVDFLADRRYPDSICLSRSNFDSHGFTVHPLFMVEPPDKQGLEAYVPRRCLLPVGVEGVLVTGLAISCQRDALPVVRMQPDVQNQGYAAGRIAALAAAEGSTPRAVDLRPVQEHLVEVGILPATALTDQDTFPLPDEAVATAVTAGCRTHHDLAVVMADPERARPLLHSAHDTAVGEDRVRYAKVLGLMGDGHGADTLAASLEAGGWDPGWNYVGMGQFGMSLSEVDTRLISLARTKDARAPALVTRYAAVLGAEPDLSHCRALALAAETSSDPHACAAALARVLAMPGIGGHALTTTASFQSRVTDQVNENQVRTRSLRELFLARGLFRCGDRHGLGAATLATYADDLRGHYARHARAVLAATRPTGS